ncbi:uncharacterized protein TM35_000671140, partial [Trypanosoma theileri]
ACGYTMAAAAAAAEVASKPSCTPGSSEPESGCPSVPGVQPPAPLPAAVPSTSLHAGGKDCTSEMTGPPCSSSDSVPDGARTDDCVTSSEKKSCPNKDGETQENCRNDSGDACTGTPKAPASEQPVKGPGEIGGQNPQDRHDENSMPGADGHSDSAAGKNRETASAAGTGGVADGRTSTSETSMPPAVPSPSTAGNTTVPSDNPQHANNEASEGAPSPTTPSSSSSATASDGGSNTASTENDNTSSGSESTTNTANTTNNEESTTTTTTTTTTLPPELTNNKKGDADSSSSISSSVWVRVPLLIVVTLACILVC